MVNATLRMHCPKEQYLPLAPSEGSLSYLLDSSSFIPHHPPSSNTNCTNSSLIHTFTAFPTGIAQHPPFLNLILLPKVLRCLSILQDANPSVLPMTQEFHYYILNWCPVVSALGSILPLQNATVTSALFLPVLKLTLSQATSTRELPTRPTNTFVHVTPYLVRSFAVLNAPL